MDRRSFFGLMGLGTIGTAISLTRIPQFVSPKASEDPKFRKVKVQSTFPEMTTASSMVWLNGLLLCPGPDMDYVILPNNTIWFEFPITSRDLLAISNGESVYHCYASEVAA